MSTSQNQPPILVVHEGAKSASAQKGEGGGAQPAASTVTSSPMARAGNSPGQVMFSRAELNQILRIYGRKVADGEWRDYAMDAMKEMAVFSVFRRSSEMPLYRIEKHPKLARRQGAYRVVAASGAILKRGHDLAQVLKVFEKKRLTVVD